MLDVSQDRFHLIPSHVITTVVEHIISTEPLFKPSGKALQDVNPVKFPPTLTLVTTTAAELIILMEPSEV